MANSIEWTVVDKGIQQGKRELSISGLMNGKKAQALVSADTNLSAGDLDQLVVDCKTQIAGLFNRDSTAP